MIKDITLCCILSILLVAANAETIKSITLDMIAKNGIGQTIVITPGYKANIGGKEVYLYGDNQCPINNDIRTFFIGGSTSDHTNCIIINDDTQAVNVTTITNNKVSNETWMVVHPEPNTMTLRNQNGDFLKPSRTN